MDEMTPTEVTTVADLDSFTRQYLETCLWAETDDDGEPLDAEYTLADFAEEALAKARRDCAAFCTAFRSEIDTDEERNATDYGHDFWLTRNGHGAGFWDGDYPEPLASRLTDAAHSFGECYVYVGDDDKLYLS